MALFKRRKKEEKSAEAEDKKSASGSASSKKESKTSMKDLYQSEGKKKKAKTAEKKAAPSTGSKKEEKETPSQEAPASGKAVTGGKAYEILVKPIITERSGDLGVQNKYVFEVAEKANKVEVSKAVKEVYGIRPVKVNIIKMKGKRVRFGRTFGKRKDWKKAIVTLPQGKTINVYEGV